MKGGTNAVGLNCCNRKIQHGHSFLNTILWQLQQHGVATYFCTHSLCALPAAFLSLQSHHAQDEALMPCHGLLGTGAGVQR